MTISPDKPTLDGLLLGLELREAKHFLARAFRAAGLSFPEEDALEILLSAMDLDRTGLMLRGAEILSLDVQKIISTQMTRRLAGEPVDHILGWREFYGRQFSISRDVLSPRADTENLIRGALLRLKNTPSPKLLDLGTGSGAIGLTLLAECELASLLATDLSEAALTVALDNAEQLTVMSRATFSAGPWWEAVPDDARFDMILSNPPYISDAAIENLEDEVTGYDPDLALRGGADGLDAYRLIIAGAPIHLESNGWLGFEIGFDQGEALQGLLARGPWAQISVEQDLGGLDRVVWAQKQG